MDSLIDTFQLNVGLWYLRLDITGSECLFCKGKEVQEFVVLD